MFYYYIISILLGIVAILSIFLAKEKKKSKYFRGRFSHDAKLLDVTRKWLLLEQCGKKILTWFHKNNVNSILIYGAGELGKRLIFELKDNKVRIKGIVDKRSLYYFYGVEGFVIKDYLPEVDAMVVTVPGIMDYIVSNSDSSRDMRIVYLGDIINQVLEYK